MVGMKGRDAGFSTGSSVRKGEGENWEHIACFSSQIVQRGTCEYLHEDVLEETGLLCTLLLELTLQQK